MDAYECKKELEALAAAHRVTLKPETLEAWYEKLKRFPVSALKSASSRLEEGDRMPTIGQIKSACMGKVKNTTKVSQYQPRVVTPAHNWAWKLWTTITRLYVAQQWSWDKTDSAIAMLFGLRDQVLAGKMTLEEAREGWTSEYGELESPPPAALVKML